MAADGMKDGRIPTWGVILMLVASLIGSWLLLKDLLSRYKKQWPW